MQLEKEFVEKRLDEWNQEKKQIVHKKDTVNKTELGKVKFDIMPWTIWQVRI
jgi:hypothetical protein